MNKKLFFKELGQNVYTKMRKKEKDSSDKCVLSKSVIHDIKNAFPFDRAEVMERTKEIGQ